MKLHVASSPCTSCPYRRDTPPGIWHPEEYAKLERFDDDTKHPGGQEIATFLCHNSPITDRPTVCRGWLTVHRESVAARLAEIIGQVTGDERYASVAEPLYSSGREAAAAGMRGVDRPERQAVEVIKKIERMRSKQRKRKTAKQRIEAGKQGGG